MCEEAKRILEDIFSDLTSNYEDNLELLERKKEKYKDHPKYNNILDKILIKEKEYLNSANKEAYNTMINTYADSVSYGIGLAKEYFEKSDVENTKKVLETLIKSFSNSYINDEYGNCVYFENEFGLTMIKGGERANVVCDKCESIAPLVESLAEIYGVKIEDEKQGMISITLKYVNKTSVIKGLKRISKPGLKVYAKRNELPKVLNGLGVAIVSTSGGVMSDREARQKNLGGEVLAFVW